MKEQEIVGFTLLESSKMEKKEEPPGTYTLGFSLMPGNGW